MIARTLPGVTPAGAVTLAAAFVCMAVSSFTLSYFGVPYDTPGGSSLARVHPSTWLFALALVMRVLEKGDPLAWIAAFPLRFPGAAVFLPILAITLVYGALVQKSPLTALVDTYFGAVAMLALHEDMNDFERRLLRRGAHVFMATNALLGLAEYFGHFRLTPYALPGEVIEADPRSSALLGHPLANAAACAAYVGALVFCDRMRATPILRAGLIALQSAAMVAFGGRTAIVLVAMLLGAKALLGAFALLGGRRFTLAHAALVAALAPLAIVALGAALVHGVADVLLDRFVSDHGSTQARFAALDLFDRFTTSDLLLGPDPGSLAERQRTLGIEYGIENSWLGLMFEYGALMAAMLVVALLALLCEFARRAQRGIGVIIAMFLILASSAASLSVKSLLFTQFSILTLGVLSAPAGRRSATSPAPARPRPYAQAAWT